MKDRIKNIGILVKQMKNIAISETYIPLVEDFSTNVRALSQSTTSDTRWISFLTIWQTITCKKRRHKCTKTLHLACAHPSFRCNSIYSFERKISLTGFFIQKWPVRRILLFSKKRVENFCTWSSIWWNISKTKKYSFLNRK